MDNLKRGNSIGEIHHLNSPADADVDEREASPSIIKRYFGTSNSHREKISIHQTRMWVNKRGHPIQFHSPQAFSLSPACQSMSN